MEEFWLLSLPNDPLNIISSEHVTSSTYSYSVLKSNVSGCCKTEKYRLPNLLFDFFDPTWRLVDELTKLETYAEVVCKKVATALLDSYGFTDNTPENRKRKKRPIIPEEREMKPFIRKFKWDVNKYFLHQSLESIIHKISNELINYEKELKKKQQEFISVKGSVAYLEKQHFSKVMTINISNIIKPEDVVETEYFTTLFAVIPKHSVIWWFSVYEHLSQFVIPRSSSKFAEDEEFELYSVILFREGEKEFRERARKQKIILRDYHYDFGRVENELMEYNNLRGRRIEITVQLLNWLRETFKDVFSIYVHVKILRCYADSVIKYGLPDKYRVALLIVKKKKIKRLRTILYNLYYKFDPTLTKTKKDMNFYDVTSGAMGTVEYYPYVSVRMITDFFILAK